MIKDIFAKNAWDMLQTSDSYLLDVRTDAEWKFVGVPNLGKKQNDYIQVSLLNFPYMDLNTDFLTEFESKFRGNKASQIFCLCRSGVRSQKAAEILAGAGYENLYNITDGFEGDIDNNARRNNVSGWRFSGLAWTQS